MPKRTRKSSRKVSRRRGSMRGGWQRLSPADLNDASMAGPSAASLSQGGEYKVMHKGQHGGGAAMAGAPAFQSQTLPANLVDSARVGGTLNAFNEIKGMQDGGRRRRRVSRKRQGGVRRRGSRKGRASRRKHGGSRRKNSRRTSRRKHGGSRRKHSRRRKQGGGAAMHPGDANAGGMLLTGRQAAGAEAAMNPEWQLAKDPTSFAPKA